MRLSILENSLYEMLKKARVTSLPEPNNPKRLWAKALVKIERKNGQFDYALAVHDMTSYKDIKVVKEMPGVGAFHDYVEIYPYSYVNNYAIPDVKKKADIISFVEMKLGFEEDYLSELSKEDLKRLFDQACIKEHLIRESFSRNSSYYSLGNNSPTVNEVAPEDKIIEFNEEKEEDKDNGEDDKQGDAQDEF